MHIVDGDKIYMFETTSRFSNWIIPLAITTFALTFSVDLITMCLTAFKLLLAYHKGARTDACSGTGWQGFFTVPIVSTLFDSGMPIVVAQWAVLVCYKSQSPWFEFIDAPTSIFNVCNISVLGWEVLNAHPYNRPL